MDTKKKILLVSLLLIIAVVIFFVFFFSGRNYKIKNVSTYTDNYNMTIFAPNKLPKSISKKVKEMVSKEKRDFFSELKDKKDDFQYELLINYETKIHGKYHFVTFNVYKYVGQNHADEYYYTYYYDDDKGEELEADYFFKEDYLEDLSRLSKIYLRNEFKKEGSEVYEEFLNDGTSEKIENFQHFYFDENGLNIMFPPYQVAPWSVGSSAITISKEDIRTFIRSDLYKFKEEDNSVTIPRVRDLSAFAGKKMIAITFDDGPSRDSLDLLNYAKTSDARYTFFLLGARVAEHSNVLKRQYSEGHQICGHSYTHRNFLRLSLDNVKDEIDRTGYAVKREIGLMPNCYRPPYGSTNNDIRQKTGLHEIIWNVDTLDWKHRNEDAVYKNIIAGAGDGNIILLHDIYPTSVRAAIRASKYLIDNGYALLTIDELARAKGIELNSNQKYFQIR